jgi:TolB-like protein
MTLDNAVVIVFQELNSTDLKGTLAVIGINTQSSELSLQIVRMLESKLFRDQNFDLVSRNRIDAVLSEQEFGLSGYVDDYSAQRIGHILGAKYILTGEITKPETQFFLNIQILETENARLIYSNTFEIDKRELQNYREIIDPKQYPDRLPGLRF